MKMFNGTALQPDETSYDIQIRLKSTNSILRLNWDIIKRGQIAMSNFMELICKLPENFKTNNKDDNHSVTLYLYKVIHNEANKCDV